MKYTAKITEKAIKYEREVSAEKIILSHDEYRGLKKVFAEALDWGKNDQDLFGVHINQLTIHGGYKNTGPKSVTLDIEVEK